MRLQIILQNKHRQRDKWREKSTSGFVIAEMILAFSLFILFSISIFYMTSSIQSLKIWSQRELSKIKLSTKVMDEIIKNKFTNIGAVESFLYGNDTVSLYIEPFTLMFSDYVEAWGRDSCEPRIDLNVAKLDSSKYFPGVLDIGLSNLSTDLEVRNGVVYLTADSTSSSKDDFYIINVKDLSNIDVLSSINTGPGVEAVEIAGHYAFLANSSSVSQLQILDIGDRSNPLMISKLKLPLPTPTTTAPFATAIFYSKDFIYLGTEKWNGTEFNIIDVSNPYDPFVAGSFETGTLINDIYVRGNRAYLATSDMYQMRVLDLSDKSNPTLENYFSPSGWKTQEGRVLSFFEESVFFGRTVGGFNISSNHESFVFPKDTDLTDYYSGDIPGGVYGVVARNPYVFLATHDTSKEFQIWDYSMKNKIFEMSLGFSPTKMVCDLSSVYFSTGDSGGLSILEIQKI